MAQFNLGRVKGDKGDKGAQGVSFSFKGEWKSGVAYKNDEITIDVVSYLGSAYACKVSHTSTADNGPSNTTNWGILLSNAFDLVQTDTINDPAKVPSSAVTYGLGQEIDTLNNNLAWQTDVSIPLSNDWTGTINVSKNGLGMVWIRGSVQVGTVSAGLQPTASPLPLGYRPLYNYMMVPMYNATKLKGLLNLGVHSNGNLIIRDVTNLSSGDKIVFEFLYKAV